MSNHTPTQRSRQPKTKVVCGIYLITCKADGKRYIGSSLNIAKRFREHKNELDRNCHGNSHLQRAWNKYGGDSFEFSILEECEPDNRFSREMHWVSETECEFNMRFPNAAKDGWIASPETRASISAAGKGRKFTEEHKAKIAASQIGRYYSPETREKIAASHRGKPLTEETKQKLSEALRGRKVPPERAARSAEKLRGRKASDEARANMSAAQKGHVLSDEHKQKISEAFKGRKITPEHHAKMVAGTRARWARIRAEKEAEQE